MGGLHPSSRLLQQVGSGQLPTVVLTSQRLITVHVMQRSSASMRPPRCTSAFSSVWCGTPSSRTTESWKRLGSAFMRACSEVPAAALFSSLTTWLNHFWLLSRRGHRICQEEGRYGGLQERIPIHGHHPLTDRQGGHSLLGYHHSNTTTAAEKKYLTKMFQQTRRLINGPIPLREKRPCQAISSLGAKQQAMCQRKSSSSSDPRQ